MQSENNQQLLNFKTGGSAGEFTRRKNWSQSILDSVRDVIHVLSNDFHILYCTDASSEILGYKPSELVGRLFTEFLHIDDVDTFIHDFRNVQNTAQTLRICYRFLRKDGKHTTLETRGQFHKLSFFGNARRIPTETSQSIDAILDLKMENELLKRKLASLRLQDKITGATQTTESFSSNGTNSTTAYESEEEGLSNGSDKDRTNSLVYTQGVEPSYGVSESLSLFTGLHYDLGERSHGISSGLIDGELKTVENNSSVLLDFNSAEIIDDMLLRDEHGEFRAKKKRVTHTEDPIRLCTDCGTMDSPEWRKGPHGPKTLCNACGLRWSKKRKMQQT